MCITFSLLRIRLYSFLWNLTLFLAGLPVVEEGFLALLFNLCIDPVEGDGDCAFTSIIMQLRNSKEWRDSDKKLFERLHELGLGGSLDEDVYQLRQLFVDNVQSKDCYQQILSISPEKLNAETERFRKEGTFSGEIGDLVIKVCSDILQVPILVVSSIPGCSYVPFIPPEQVMTNTLYIAYTSYGPGHYDSTSQISQLQGKKTCYNIATTKRAP